jgi:hypothetical protein
MTLSIVPSWLPGLPWLQTAQITIKNFGTSALPANSLLQFSLAQGQTASAPASGLSNFSQVGNVVKGNLTNAVLPGKPAVLNIPVNFASVQLAPPLPKEFLVDNSPVNPIVDMTAPTTPSNLSVVSEGVNNLTVKWNASKDNLGNVVYNVQYQQGSNGLVQEVQTELTQLTLNNLAADAEYRVSVVASDLSGNKSFASLPLTASTLSSLPVVAWGNLNPVPVVDTTASPTPDLGNYLNLTGVKNYLLGFVSGLPVSSSKENSSSLEVVPAFGGLSQLLDSNTNLPFSSDARVSNYLKAGISTLRESGGDVVMSFGGPVNLSTKASSDLPTNLPMEALITDVEQLVQNYQAIIQNYNLQGLDFNFPESFLNNQDLVNRFVAAISSVLSNNPNLKTSFSLPVSNTSDVVGFDSVVQQFLQLLSNAGLQPSLINLLPQGSANSFSGIQAVLNGLSNDTQDTSAFSQDTKDTSGVLSQLQALYPNLSVQQVFSMLGVSPTFGQNNSGQVFNILDQTALNAYALLNGLTLGGFTANNDIEGLTGLLPPEAPGAFLTLLATLDSVLPIPPVNETKVAGEVLAAAE